MAKRDTYGYRAGLERKKAQRRIQWHKRILAKENISKQMREKHESKIRDLKAAQEATRTRTREGRAIPDRKDKAKMDENLRKLESMNKRSVMYSRASERANKVAQIEINKASVGDESSRFTQEEIQIFYRATQPAWQREGVLVSERNEAILEYYGRSDLGKLVEEVSELNKIALRVSKIMPEEELTEEQAERYANEPDVTDEKPSPPTYQQAVSDYLDRLRSYVISPERQ